MSFSFKTTRTEARVPRTRTIFFMSEKANGWRNGILPAVLAALPAGSVYAYPYFSGAFQAICGASPSACSWIFSASIFFLGMGAAFFGPVVEKNPRKSLLLAAVLYLAGMSVTSAGLLAGSYWIVFAGYGVINGVGQGVAYLSPVKAAMSWFPKRKGLAGAASIVAFGLGSAAAIAVSRAVSGFGCAWTFAAFAVLFPAMIALAAVLLRKNPDSDAVLESSGEPAFRTFSRPGFAHAWSFMFLNILAGLVVIGNSARILSDVGTTGAALALVLSAAGFFNGGFRLVFAWISDKLGIRADVWTIIACVSVAVSVLMPIRAGILTVLSVLAVNACYGGGFSTLAPILSDAYGQKGLSRIHGLALSAWAMAALAAGFLSALPLGAVFCVIPCLYLAEGFAASRFKSRTGSAVRV